jgi:hypothetical protein
MKFGVFIQKIFVYSDTLLACKITYLCDKCSEM